LARNVFVERFWRAVKYEEVYLKAYEGVAATSYWVAAALPVRAGRKGNQSCVCLSRPDA
jgi:putative transposase